MFHHYSSTCAEAAACRDRVTETTAKNVDLFCLNAVVLCQSTAVSTQNSEAEVFVQVKAVLELLFELNEFGQVRDDTVVFEQSLGNDEPASKWQLLLAALALKLEQKLFESLHIVMAVETHSRARVLQAFPDAEVHAGIGDNYVAHLAKRRNDTAGHGKRL